MQRERNKKKRNTPQWDQWRMRMNREREREKKKRRSSSGISGG